MVFFLLIYLLGFSHDVVPHSHDESNREHLENHHHHFNEGHVHHNHVEHGNHFDENFKPYTQDFNVNEFNIETRINGQNINEVKRLLYLKIIS